MAAQCNLAEVTFRRIYLRQWKDRWREQYDAGIHARGREVPSLSGAGILTPQKVGRREFHCLSRGEVWAALLALFNPAVWEIHEQRILYPSPRRHFLEGHPRGAGHHWPPLRGTLDVASRLGFLPHIESIRIEGASAGEYSYVPVFWLGDLLLFLEDEAGPYLVNWSVKDTLAAFGKPGPRRHGKMPTNKELEQAHARHRIEVVYYEDAGIPTREIGCDQIDTNLAYNLRDLCLCEAPSAAVNEEKRSRAIETFRQEVGSETPANVVVSDVAQRLAIDPADSKCILYQALWARQVRIDLFQRFLLNKPLRPERVDPLQRYSNWFAR